MTDRTTTDAAALESLHVTGPLERIIPRAGYKSPGRTVEA